MADERVKVYKSNDADSNEVVGNRRVIPMFATIFGLAAVIILAIIFVVNLLR
jgi:hypothetical protein